jgi:hypothetical protein
MTSITLRATVDEGHRLTIELPEEIPAGPVEVIVRSLVPQGPATGPLTREEARARLRAAGILSEYRYAPPDAIQLTPEERDELGRAFAGSQPSEVLIDEDRGER